MDTALLQEIGLTKAEAKIYLALLELGQTTAGPIIQHTNLQNSVTHTSLKKLAKKGFVSYIIKGKTKHYQASDPKIFLQYIEERKKRFEKIIPQLEARRKPIPKQGAHIYEGLQGFKNCVYGLIEEANPGDEYLFFSFDHEDPDKFDALWDFYPGFAELRKEKKLDLKGLAPRRLKHKMKNRPDIKWVDFPIIAGTIIFQDKVIFNPWEEENFMTYVIHSRQLAKSLKRHFYAIYNSELALK